MENPSKPSTADNQPQSADFRNKRLIEEHKNPDSRTEAQVDRDRLLYSAHFARLAEVTQVVSADHGYVFHNRLTHSLKVAQIARRMAEYLLINEDPDQLKSAGGLCPDVCEAAALAHDIGHPPFGHIAETVLDEELKKHDVEDGFEGNAQSFRVVTAIAVGDGQTKTGRVPIQTGLNLTRATLNAILKYPWYHNENSEKQKKWGAYKSEEAHFQHARQDFKYGTQTKSLEAEIMDWADDITYAVHDVVDFYCAGKIPLQELVQESQERKQFLEEVFNRNPKMRELEDAYREAFTKVIKDVFQEPLVFPFRHYTGARYERVTLWQKMTKMITRYIGALKVSIANKCLVHIEQGLKFEIEMLKQLTWHYVILNTDLATLQHGQRHLVRTVLTTLWDRSSDKDSMKLFPPFFEDTIVERKDDEKGRLRVVADYVSGLTEREITSVYKKLQGIDVGPFLQ